MKSNHKLMLVVLTILILAKFVLVPIFYWQQEQILQIESKNERLAKAKNVISRFPQITRALDAIKKTNKTKEALYFKSASLNDFKLQQQQQIELLFAKHGLQVNNFNWVVEVPGQITEVRAKIVFSGSTKNFALLQLDIARFPKLLNIKKWALRIKTRKENSLGKATGSVLLVVYNISAQSEVL